MYLQNMPGTARRGVGKVRLCLEFILACIYGCALQTNELFQQAFQGGGLFFIHTG